MLPVGCVGFACIGGAGRCDVATGTISEVGEMSRCLVLAGETGEGAVARHLRRGNLIPGRRAERRRLALLDVIFGVLLDDLGHFFIMTKTSDNARLSDVLCVRHGVRFVLVELV